MLLLKSLIAAQIYVLNKKSNQKQILSNNENKVRVNILLDQI